MDCVVLVPEGKIAQGKLAQAIVYGARVLQIAQLRPGAQRRGE